MLISEIEIGVNPPWDINVIIEIPKGGEPVKYELDKDSGIMVVDRFLHTAMYYPCNYGFLPHSLGMDGDPLDMLVVGSVPVIPGCLIRVRPVGVLQMEDESGMDEKIICVPVDKLSPFYSKVISYQDLPENFLQQIAHFFSHYKDLEAGKWVKVSRWGEPDEAAELILQAIERAKKQPKKTQSKKTIIKKVRAAAPKLPPGEKSKQLGRKRKPVKKR